MFGDKYRILSFTAILCPDLFNESMMRVSLTVLTIDPQIRMLINNNINISSPVVVCSIDPCSA
jgi:hypothetical protein